MPQRHARLRTRMGTSVPGRLGEAVVEPVRSAARGVPPPVALYRSRRATLPEPPGHVRGPARYRPSTAEPGEAVVFTLQAWDRYERLVPGVEGPVELSTTDRDDRGSEEDAYYPRIEKDDGGMAWAGPVWVGVERECYQGVLSFVGGARPRPSPSL